MDTAKCAGVGCSIRDACLRFTRPAVDGQQWIQPLYGYIERCMDHQPLPVEPHGGASEEGDGA